MLSLLISAAVLWLPFQSHAQSAPTQDDVKRCNTKDSAGQLEACIKIAETGNADAAKIVGSIYFFQNNGEKSLFWFRKASVLGQASAQYTLGMLLVEGKFGPPNKTEGISWLVKAAQQSHESASALLVSKLLEDPTPENKKLLMEWAPKVADAGAVQGAVAMGLIYKRGYGVPIDLTKAKSWFQRAVQAKNNSESTTARIEYAESLLFPAEGRRDTALARQLLASAWQQGSAWAGYRLAELDIYEGKLKQDPAAVRTLLEQAWKQSEVECPIGTAGCGFDVAKLTAVAREQGIGGPVDIKGAKDIYDKQHQREIGTTESELALGGGGRERYFTQKSALKDTSGPFTIEQQRELGLKLVRDLTAKSSGKSATRPVLDFDIQVFTSDVSPNAMEQIAAHVDAASSIYESCDVRLRKARVWNLGAYDKDAVAKISKIQQPVINLFFLEKTEGNAYGYATREGKSVVLTSKPSGNYVGPQMSGIGSNLLAHELGHVFTLNHPASLEPSVMQYGWLSRFDLKFTPQQCEQIRKHELVRGGEGAAETVKLSSYQEGFVRDTSTLRLASFGTLGSAAVLQESTRIAAQVGRPLPTLPTGTKIEPFLDSSIVVAGGDAIVVDPQTRLVVHIQPQLFNYVADGSPASAWTSRGKAVNSDAIAKLSNTAKASAPIKTLHDIRPDESTVPMSIPGAKVATPEQVAKLYQDAASGKGESPAVFFTTLALQMRLPNAKSALKYAQGVDLNDELQKTLDQFTQTEQLTKTKPIVIYSRDPQDWRAYNVALRFAALGFTNVSWMRDGLEGWVARDLPVTMRVSTTPTTR